ncbi:MAG: ECF-type sigma factor, partial [Planctomycetota bacterium]|nr:ECF-type sigma factor [Planctomycetota bacterium]
MADPPREDVTQLLQRLNAGESSANDGLMDAVYDQLRAMAHSHMNREFGRGQPGATLQPTALVNETYLKLIKQRQQYDSRGQFFAIATKLMIRVLLDYQRQRKAAKRGGG